MALIGPAANYLLFSDPALKVQVILRSPVPLGGAIVTFPAPRGSVENVTLAQFMYEIESTPVSRRYPVIVDDSDLAMFEATLYGAVARPDLDVACIFVRGRRCDSGGVPLNVVSIEFQRIALLTLTQIKALRMVTSVAELLLDNDQIISSVDASDSASIARNNTLEGQDLRFGPAAQVPVGHPGEVLLQASPSAPFSRSLRSGHSYFCVLHPDHREEFARNFVAVRNPILESESPGLAPRVSVLPLYDTRQPVGRVALDHTTALAIGLRSGEQVGLIKLKARGVPVGRRALGLRHAVCRVHPAEVGDMEKPIVRVPGSVLDMLGLGAGGRVVLEALGSTGAVDSVLAVTTVRALPLRIEEGVTTPAWGGLSLTSVHGDDDLPVVLLDLNTRAALGIMPGSPVYVRPAITGVLAQEFTSISFVLLGAAFSASAVSKTGVAIATLSLYLLLSMIALVVRLR